jgi:hypothetical protein
LSRSTAIGSGSASIVTRGMRASILLLAATPATVG